MEIAGLQTWSGHWHCLQTETVSLVCRVALTSFALLTLELFEG